MKKIVIPAVLAATILVAGMFALMPVQKASTIHSGLTSGTAAVSRDNQVITDIALGANERMIILDNAGIGGVSDVEVTARLPGAGTCTVQTIAQGAGAWVAMALGPFPVAAVGELLVPVHGDQANVEAVSIFGGGTGCALAASSNEYVSLSVVGT
jgi:hypothetical protein